MSADADDPNLIDCDRHGRGPCAVVCRHHINARGRAVGFIENCSDPADLQAWCTACEERFLDEGGMTKAFVAYNNFAVVCIACYAELKQRHTPGLA